MIIPFIVTRGGSTRHQRIVSHFSLPAAEWALVARWAYVQDIADVLH